MTLTKEIVVMAIEDADPAEHPMYICATDWENVVGYWVYLQYVDENGDFAFDEPDPEQFKRIGEAFVYALARAEAYDCELVTEFPDE